MIEFRLCSLVSYNLNLNIQQQFHWTVTRLQRLYVWFCTQFEVWSTQSIRTFRTVFTSYGRTVSNWRIQYKIEIYIKEYKGFFLYHITSAFNNAVAGYFKTKFKSNYCKYWKALTLDVKKNSKCKPEEIFDLQF